MTASSPYSLCILVAMVLVASPAANATGINWNMLTSCGRAFGNAVISSSALLHNINPWQWLAGAMMAYLGNNGVSGAVIEPVVHALPRNGSAWSYNYGLCRAKNSGSQYTFCSADEDQYNKPACQRTGYVFSWGLGILAVASVVHGYFSYKMDEQNKQERKEEQAVKRAYFTYVLEKQKKEEQEREQAVQATKTGETTLLNAICIEMQAGIRDIRQELQTIKLQLPVPQPLPSPVVQNGADMA